MDLAITVVRHPDGSVDVQGPPGLDPDLICGLLARGAELVRQSFEKQLAAQRGGGIEVAGGNIARRLLNGDHK